MLGIPDFADVFLSEMPDGVLLADDEGVIRMWNAGCERIFGFSAEEAIGQSLDIIIPENLRARHWEGTNKPCGPKTRYGAGDLRRACVAKGWDPHLRRVLHSAVSKFRWPARRHRSGHAGRDEEVRGNESSQEGARRGRRQLRFNSQRSYAMWPDRRLIKLFGIEHPILLAPMAGPSTPELCVAVSEAGGLGSLACALSTPEQIRTGLSVIRQRTNKPINLNFLRISRPSPIRTGRQSGRRVLLITTRSWASIPTPRCRTRTARLSTTTCQIVEEFKPEVISFHFGLPEKASCRG